MTSANTLTIKPATNFNYSLESLRGFAALLVVLCHSWLLGPSADPTYQLTGIWQYAAPGHLSVLLFFILSGYVIGITNKKPIVTLAMIGEYLKKRFVRIYPLYFIAIIFTILIAAAWHEKYTYAEIMGYLFFLQGIVVKIPAYNPPIWSLSYEVAYYLFFLIVSAKQWKVQWVILFFLLLGLVLTKFQLQPIVLVSYSYGAVFWFIGLWISQSSKSRENNEYGKMLAFILLILCYERMDLLYSMLNFLKIDVSEVDYPVLADRFVIFSDFSRLVICLPLIACFSGNKIKYTILLEYIAFAMPGLYFIAYVVSGKIHQKNLFDTVFIALIFYCVSLLSFFNSKRLDYAGKALIEKLLFIGTVSYGIYIIHYPIYYIFLKLGIFSGTAVSFIVRTLVYLIIVFVIGWMLEKKVQPYFKNKFFPLAQTAVK